MTLSSIRFGWRIVTSRAGLAVLFVLVSVVCVWSLTRHDTMTVTEPSQIPEIVERIPQGYVPLEECRALVRNKEKLAAVVELPAVITDDPDKQVAEVMECKPSDDTVTVASVIDTKTGRTTFWQGQRPPSFFSTRPLTTTTEAGIQWTYDIYGQQLWEADGRWTFWRTGNIHYALTGRAESDFNGHFDMRGGVQITYRR